MVCILALAIVSSSVIIAIEKQGIYGKPVPRFLKRVFLRNKSFKLRLKELKASIVHVSTQSSLATWLTRFIFYYCSPNGIALLRETFVMGTSQQNYLPPTAIVRSRH